MAITTKTPNYSKEQLEDMENTYPEITNPNRNVQQVYFDMGVRSVIKRMRDISEYHRSKANGSKL